MRPLDDPRCTFCDTVHTQEEKDAHVFAPCFYAAREDAETISSACQPGSGYGHARCAGCDCSCHDQRPRIYGPTLTYGQEQDLARGLRGADVRPPMTDDQRANYVATFGRPVDGWRENVGDREIGARAMVALLEENYGAVYAGRVR